MPSTPIEALPQLRLLQLVSPTLPIGAFAYSQGLEWAVHCAWVTDSASLRAWLHNLLHSSVAHLEVPLLARLYQASATQADAALTDWSQYLLACRETQELRQEERLRGRALLSLLPKLDIPLNPTQRAALQHCQLAGFAYAAQHWHIPLTAAAQGYVWSWLENTALAGVKLIPLGQTQGQQLIAELAGDIPAVVEHGLQLTDAEIGASCFAQALASSCHETQYTRLFRS
jgi:urease accessory protein